MRSMCAATRARKEHREDPEGAALIRSNAVEVQQRCKAGEMTKAEFEMALASLE